jgi:hypothetical protein
LIYSADTGFKVRRLATPEMEANLVDPLQIRTLQLIIGALRRIGDDIYIEATGEEFCLRSLNSTRSALPVVAFKPDFFHDYIYKCRDPSLVCQIPGPALITAFKLVTQPTSLTMAIVNSTNTFQLTLVDRFGIRHEWELCLGEAVVLHALYDLDSAAVQIHCRSDVFTGLSEAFRGSSTVTLEIVPRDSTGAITFRTSIGDQSSLSSTLSIRRSDRCQTQILNDCEKVMVSFNLSDFMVGIKIGKILNQRISMYVTAPGHPVVIKTALQGQIHFEMPLATNADSETDEAEEGEGEPDLTGSSSVSDVGPPGSPSSQVSPWPGTRAVKSEPAAPEVFSREAGVSRESARLSQLIRQGIFSESPPFPFRRRTTGQYAEASQPVSEDSDSDA